MGNKALYTKLCAGVILLALVATALDAAQRSRSRRPESRGPRALAVIEFPTDPKAQPRLVPISLLDEGRTWDAAVYRAKPVPMALESGVVYEAEKSGKSEGFFTVDVARQVRGRWVGRGRWEPHGARTYATASTPAPAAPAEDPDAPPVLRKPGSGEATKAAEPETPPVTGAPAPAQRSEPEDPDRPLLRRNPGGRKAEAGDVIPDEPAEFGVARTMVAISDAAGEPSRPYKFEWSADEERRVREMMTQQAIQALRPHLGTVRKGQAPALDTQFFPFDLEYDNYGDILMSARWQRPAQTNDAARDYFVTLVAHLDIDGKPRVIFSRLTDSRRLDAQPRLELVDAVDADGDGRGELLFRAIGDRSYTYELYRVFPQNVVRLAETSEFPLPRASAP